MVGIALMENFGYSPSFGSSKSCIQFMLVIQLSKENQKLIIFGRNTSLNGK
jgi:hypothetical protein